VPEKSEQKRGAEKNGLDGWNPIDLKKNKKNGGKRKKRFGHPNHVRQKGCSRKKKPREREKEKKTLVAARKLPGGGISYSREGSAKGGFAKWDQTGGSTA